MSTQILRDRAGSVIAKIETRSNGIQAIYDRNESLMGTFEPKFNKTYDRYGHLIGEGNLLTSLIRY
jgi:hypothetical protein